MSRVAWPIEQGHNLGTKSHSERSIAKLWLELSGKAQPGMSQNAAGKQELRSCTRDHEGIEMDDRTEKTDRRRPTASSDVEDADDEPIKRCLEIFCSCEISSGSLLIPSGNQLNYILTSL